MIEPGPGKFEAVPAAESRRAELQRMLARLEAPPGQLQGDRRVVGLSKSESLTGILDEINEAVMSRRLCLENAKSERLELDLRNRRLCRVAIPPDFETFLEMYGGGGREVPPELDAAIAEVARRLELFCDPGEVQVVTSARCGPADLRLTGISAANLRHAISTFGSVPEQPGEVADHHALTRFAMDCPEIFAAAFVSDPDHPVLLGDQAAASRLLDALAGFGAVFAQEADGEAAVILFGAEDAEKIVAFFTDGADPIACLALREHQGALLGHWNNWLTQNL